MAAITQHRNTAGLTGRRFGSFAGKVATEAPVGDAPPSFFLPANVHIDKHHFPRTSSHIGARHHHTFTIFPRLSPAGV